MMSRPYSCIPMVSRGHACLPVAFTPKNIPGAVEDPTWADFDTLDIDCHNCSTQAWVYKPFDAF